MECLQSLCANLTDSRHSAPCHRGVCVYTCAVRARPAWCAGRTDDTIHVRVMTQESGDSDERGACTSIRQQKVDRGHIEIETYAHGSRHIQTHVPTRRPSSHAKRARAARTPGVRESWRKSHSVANCEQPAYRLVHCILNAHSIAGFVVPSPSRNASVSVRVCMSKRGQLAPTA